MKRFYAFFDSSGNRFEYDNRIIDAGYTRFFDKVPPKANLEAAGVRVVPPGIDERYSPSGDKSDHPLVVAVGRLMPSKGFDRLIAAIDAVRRTRPDVELVIVGEGYERDALQKQFVRYVPHTVKCDGKAAPELLVDHQIIADSDINGPLYVNPK